MRQRGFSLVEVLAALVILTIVVTTSLVMFTERRTRLRQANEMVLAYQSLWNEAECQRRIPFNLLTPADDKNFVSDTAVLRPLGQFKTFVSITNVNPTVRTVTLTVTWPTNRKATLSVARVDTQAGNLF